MSWIFSLLVLVGLAHVEWRVDIAWNTARHLSGASFSFPYGKNYRVQSLDDAKIEIKKARALTGVQIAQEDNGEPIIATSFLNGRIERLVIGFSRCLDQTTVLKE